MNVFWADFRATFCDITKPDSKLFLQQLSAIEAVERVHLQAGRTWVLLTEAAEGGWGTAFGQEELAALAARKK